MKTKQTFLTVLSLLLFVIAGLSDIARAQESPQVQQDKERHKNISRSFWDGRGASISTEALLRDPQFRTALGVSDKYYQEILASVRNTVGRLSDNPEYEKIRHEGDELFRVVWGKEPGSNVAMTGSEQKERERIADPKASTRLQEIGESLESMHKEFLAGSSKRHVAAFEEALSSEFKQKIQEAWLAAMGETSTISPRWFEALYLTDTQREQMERIKKELEPELEKHLEIYGNNAAKILERVNAALRQRQEARISFSGSGNAQEALNAFMKNLQEEPEHKRLLDESYASSKAFATLFRTRMSGILTDDQRSRLQELLDNPPPHAQLLIQRLRKENWGQYKEGEFKKVDGKDVWVPGPDSWKPGDPLPETIPQEKESKGSFPRQTE